MTDALLPVVAGTNLPRAEEASVSDPWSWFPFN
jgi:hypothetical protein